MRCNVYLGVLAILLLHPSCRSHSFSSSIKPLRSVPISQSDAASAITDKFRICGDDLESVELNELARKEFPGVFTDDPAAIPVVLEHEQVEGEWGLGLRFYNDILAGLSLTFIPELDFTSSEHIVRVRYPLLSSADVHESRFFIEGRVVRSMLPWGLVLAVGGGADSARGEGWGTAAREELQDASLAVSVASLVQQLGPTEAELMRDEAALAGLAISAADSYGLALARIAVLRIDDEGSLARVVRESASASVQALAASRISPEGMPDLFHGIEQLAIRKAVLAGLDSRRLESLADGALEPEVRMAAAVALGRSDWDQFFGGVSASVDEVGNVLGAVALIDEPRPTSTQVVAACHAFIRRGDASRVPELIDLLFRFGDKRLAEDYINCGNRELAAAGKEWASSRGYRVISGSGSARVKWGGGR